MEEWQDEHIKQNLPDLIRLTNCEGPLLFAELQKDLFSEYDIQSIRSKATLQEKADELYAIAKTKIGSFEKLTIALNNTKQTGALQILLDGYEKQGKLSPILKENAASFLLKKDLIPPDQPKYYISRTLSHKTKLKEEIFDSGSDHIFLIQGTTKHALMKKVQEVGVSGEQLHLDKLEVSFIILECEHDSDTICEKTTKPVHVIQYKDGSFYWRKSNKGMDTLEMLIESEKEITVGESELSKNCLALKNNAFCISDSPGMGKTFLLANLARKIKEDNKNSIVMFIVLQELTQHIRAMIDSPSSALEAIASFAADGESIRSKLHEKLLSTENQFHIFFDGYDEVMPEKVGAVDKLLKHVNKLKHIRIYVSTRPHLKSRLQNILNVISYDILYFDEANQVEFLTKYWSQHELSEELKGVPLEEFAVKCLNELQEKMTDNEKKIAGIPLQCMMLAEVYAKDAKRCIKSKIVPKLSVRINSIFEMYKALVNQKFGRIKRFVSIEEEIKYRNTRRDCIQAHIYHSIDLLFPEWTKKFKNYCRRRSAIEENMLYSIGLTEKSPQTNAPRFLHRTFAEYFMAEFAVKNVGKSSDCMDFVFRIIFGRNAIKLGQETNTESIGPIPYNNLRYPVIAYFMEMHLQEYLKYDDIDHKLISQQLSSTHFEDLSLAISACCSLGYESCFDLARKVLSCFDLAGKELFTLRDHYFKHLPHLAVIHSKSSKMVEKVMDFTEAAFKMDVMEYHVFSPPLQDDDSDSDLPEGVEFDLDDGYNFPWISNCTPLHVAVYQGNYDIAQYLMRRYGGSVSNLKYLIHACVRYSAKECQSTIDEKIGILDLLYEINPNWLEGEFEETHCTPILQCHVHLSILKHLVNLGANINAYSSSYGTVLHRSGDYRTCGDVLKWAISNGFNIINHRNRDRRTPVIYAIKILGIDEEELIQLFHDAGADFNLDDDSDTSALYYALDRDECPKAGFISKLIDLGADVNKEEYAQVPLGRCYGKDDDNNDCWSTTESLNIIRLLLEKGYNRINCTDASSVVFKYLATNTSLLRPVANAIHHVIALEEDENMIEHYHSKGANFNTIDSKGNPVLFCALSKNIKFIEKMLEHGADVNYENFKGETVAHKVLQCETGKAAVDKLKFLISKGFSLINKTSKPAMGYNTRVRLELAPLHYALLEFRNDDDGMLDVIHYLLEMTGDLKCLMHACVHNTNDSNEVVINRKISILKKLHAADATRVEEKPDVCGCTALLEQNVHLRLLQCLMELGADINAICPVHGTLLHMDVEENSYLEKFQLAIVSGFSLLNYQDARGLTSLHKVMKSYGTEVEYEYSNPEEYLGNSVLVQAMMTGNVQKINEPAIDPFLLQLFQKNHADFNAVDKDGYSVLFHAVKTGNVDLIGKVLDYGADVNYQNADADSSAHIFLRHGASEWKPIKFLEIFKLLVSRGFAMINHKNNVEGITPLHYIASCDTIDEDDKLLDFFHEVGADFNVTNPYGDSVLFSAIAIKRSVSYILKIMTYGGDCYHLNKLEYNALHVAAIAGNSSALEFLLQKFGDVNVPDEDGDTPLHFLFCRREVNYGKVLEILFKAGANFGAKNRYGKIPLVTWIQRGRKPFNEIMESKEMLPITEDIASQGLTALVRREKLLWLYYNREYGTDHVQELVKYLIEKGGKLLDRDGTSFDWSKLSDSNWKSVNEIKFSSDLVEKIKTQMQLDEEIATSSFQDLIGHTKAPVEVVFSSLLETNSEHFINLCHVINRLGDSPTERQISDDEDNSESDFSESGYL